MTVDKDAARRWIRAKPCVAVQAWQVILYLWHHKRPRLFPSIDFSSFLLMTVAVVVLVAIASVPVWNKVITASGVDFSTLEWRDVWQIAAVSGLLFLRWVTDSIKVHSVRGKAERDERHKLSLDQITSFKAMFPALNPPRRASAATQRDQAAAAILRCIHQTVRIAIKKSGKDYLCANLVLFRGDGGEVADIVARSVGDRDPKVGLVSSELVAYYVAERRVPFVVNDLKKVKLFPQKRPGTETVPPYRSILIVPLLDETTPEARGSCKAVVTVDSSVPYEFWGAIRTDMQVQIQPYLEGLKLLYMNHAEGVPSHA